jgi:MFS family permease
MVLHGVSYFLVGVISSAFYFVSLATRIPVTLISEKVSLKVPIATGLCFYAVGPIIISIYPVLPAFIAANILLGLGSALFVPATMALIATTFSDKALKTSVMTTYSSFISLGVVFGPLVGGALFIFNLKGLNLAFVVSGLLNGIAAIVVLVGLGNRLNLRSPSKAGLREPLPAGFWTGLRNIVIYRSAYSFVLSTGAFIVLFAYFRLAYAAVVLGLFLSIIMIADAGIQYLSGPFFLKFSHVDFGRVFMLVSAAAFVPLILLSWGNGVVALFFLAYSIFYLGRNVGSTFVSKNLVLSLPQTRAMYVSAMVSSIGLFAGGVGLILAGFLYSISPLYVWIAFLSSAVVIAIVLPSTVPSSPIHKVMNDSPKGLGT